MNTKIMKRKKSRCKRSPKKIDDGIDVRLLQLINQYENGELIATEVAIERGRTMKRKDSKCHLCVFLKYTLFSYWIIFGK